MTDSITRVRDSLHGNRRRIWAICYRMTGNRADAEDLTQEASRLALERSGQVQQEDATGWLLTLTTRLCLDHLRRARVARRASELVDPLPGQEWTVVASDAPESAVILREDVRFAVVVALQRLSPRQRAVLILHDVCDRSLSEVAEVLDTNANAAKALLRRARTALSLARVHENVDVPVDQAVVEEFARAIESGSVERLTALLAADVWGVVDGGGVVQAASKPTFGRRAVGKQWANAKRRLGVEVTAKVLTLNGEAAIVLRLRSDPSTLVAVVHAETRNGQLVALRVSRDPARLSGVARLFS
ncbi:MAG: sigma-70 family RNA polymerase sigma factor [Polyangiaceae bacterium]